MVATLLVLAGCVNVSAQVKVDRDGNASGPLSMEISRQTAAWMQVYTAEQWLQWMRDQEVAEDATDAGEDMWDGDWEASETAGSLRLTKHVNFANGDLWSITTDGMDQTFSMAGSGNSQGGQLELDIEFAGEVTGVSGQYIQKVDTNKVRISGPLGETGPTTATVDLARGSVNGWAIALLVFAGLGVVCYLGFRGKPQPSSTPPSGAEPGTLDGHDTKAEGLDLPPGRGAVDDGPGLDESRPSRE